MHETPLIAEHRAAGAKMVDFAGWEMPLHYGSQIEEHHAVRRDAGVFDTSHMLAIDVTGPASRPFLRRLLANDVARLQGPGQALYSCMLAEDGGVRDDLIAYFMAEGRFRLVVNAATAQGDLDWLEAQRPAGVALRARRDLAMLAVQGPNALDRMAKALPSLRSAGAGLAKFTAVEIGEMFVARTGYTGEDGVELLMAADQAAHTWRCLVAAGARPCGLGARDTLRLEAGLPLYGQDMDATVTPFECGLAWTVNLTDGREFIGRQALLARPRRFHAAGLVLDTHNGVLRHGQHVTAAPAEGTVTSGSFSPTMRRSIGFARLGAALPPGETVQVAVRGSLLDARVVKPPFVRHGKILV